MPSTLVTCFGVVSANAFKREIDDSAIATKQAERKIMCLLITSQLLNVAREQNCSALSLVGKLVAFKDCIDGPKRWYRDRGRARIACLRYRITLWNRLRCAS